MDEINPIRVTMESVPVGESLEEFQDPNLRNKIRISNQGRGHRAPCRSLHPRMASIRRGRNPIHLIIFQVRICFEIFKVLKSFKIEHFLNRSSHPDNSHPRSNSPNSPRSLFQLVGRHPRSSQSFSNLRFNSRHFSHQLFSSQFSSNPSNNPSFNSPVFNNPISPNSQMAFRNSLLRVYFHPKVHLGVYNSPSEAPSRDSRSKAFSILAAQFLDLAPAAKVPSAVVSALVGAEAVVVVAVVVGTVME